MLNANQLVWRCRRGVRELDVLFGRFLETEFGGLSDPEKRAFERLLDIQDPTIMDWLFARTTIEDDSFASIIQQLRVLSGLTKK